MVPPGPETLSAMRSAVKVFPVPQAMMSFPRRCAANPVRTPSIACSWWGSSVRGSGWNVSASGLSRLRSGHRNGWFARSANRSTVHGGVSPLMAFVAFRPHWSPVSTTSLVVNAARDENEMKESRSFLSIRVPGA